MNRYELTSETKVVFGVRLARIRSLVEIPVIGVKVGDLGGWVEKESNLSQVSGEAWVSDDAQVSGLARVYGQARVSGEAQVSGQARVSGKARVYGQARVSGKARLQNSREYLMLGPLGSRNATLTAWVEGTEIRLATGCFLGSVVEFRKRLKETHPTGEHRDAYLAAIAFVKKRFAVRAVPRG